MIRAHQIGENSAFAGQTCALCKQEFGAGDEIVICPEDGSRHHVRCWQANGNKCTAYGCRGAGAVGTPALLRPNERRQRERSQGRPRIIEGETGQAQASSAARPVPNAPGSKVRTLPASSLGCAQTCILIAIAIAIVFFALGCFGLWAIADYLMMDVWSLPYRAPLAPASIGTFLAVMI